MVSMLGPCNQNVGWFLNDGWVLLSRASVQAVSLSAHVSSGCSKLVGINHELLSLSALAMVEYFRQKW